MSARASIVKELFSRLATVTDVALVIDIDTQEPEKISQKLAAGAHVIEVLISDDEAHDGTDTLQTDMFTFRVALLTHIGTVTLNAGETWSMRACDIDAEIYRLYTCVGGVPNQDAEQWNGSAIQTRRVSGGSLFVGDDGSRTVMSVFDITYRFAYGNPGSPA